MTRRCRPAAAWALAGALAAAGCGFGPGPSIGQVGLTVTRDYGARTLLKRVQRSATESETAMRLLDRNANVSTRYGGGFVEAVDGLSGEQGGGRRYDWFYYVNGVEAPVGSADYPLHGGDRVWWDYRDWTAAMRVPAVVGSYPEPFVHGYEGERHPLRIRCVAAPVGCPLARHRLAAAAGHPRVAADPIRVLVGPWSALRHDRAAGAIEAGPARSGVFADFVRTRDGWRLQPLGADGKPVGAPLRSGLVAATRLGEAAPTWVITGSDAAAVRAAAAMLDAPDLRDRYAVAVHGGRPEALPAQ